MPKFKTGDQVMFKYHKNHVPEFSDVTELDLYQVQTVEDIYDYTVKLKGDPDYWDVDYFEHFEDWAKHQRKVEE